MTPEEIKALQDRAEAAEKAAEVARKAAESAQKLNESLKKTIIEKEKQTTAAVASTALLPAEPVTVDGKKYRIVFPRVIHKGKEYNAFQIAKDPVLQKELVEMGSGALEEA